jgi:hypothetical protein
MSELLPKHQNFDVSLLWYITLPMILSVHKLGKELWKNISAKIL